jgi:hypothetical protein
VNIAGSGLYPTVHIIISDAESLGSTNRELISSYS